ncbi:glycine betaine/proline transport system substrate-binding protein [Limibacillus sp. MBR-115]|jgi:glycine betaine/proline transport system substrate-binding protein
MFVLRKRVEMLFGAAAIAASVLVLGSTAAHAGMPGEGKVVQPMTTGQSGHVFYHAVVQIALEKLGYEVKPHLEAEYPAIHLSVAQGDADYTAGHWDPLHQKFFDQAGGDEKMTRVGHLISGAGQGYFIDKKTANEHGIDNIGRFSDPKIAALFDTNGDGKANLTGCNPGWGCERVIEHQLDAFDLRGSINHDQGSYFALIADTITRYQGGESIFFYTWSPTWVGSILKPGDDVVQLNVPFSSLPGQENADTALPDGRNPGFGVNSIRVLANNEFLAENPAARRLFELLEIPIADVSAENNLQHQGEDAPEQIFGHAKDWIAQNQAQFDAWIAEAAAVTN